MNEYDFDVDEEGRAFCDGIVRNMVELFGISIDEAVGRVNRQWKGHHLNSHDDYPGFRYREDAEFWAHRIYYKSSVTNWSRGEQLPTKPYP